MENLDSWCSAQETRQQTKSRRTKLSARRGNWGSVSDIAKDAGNKSNGLGPVSRRRRDHCCIRLPEEVLIELGLWQREFLLLLVFLLPARTDLEAKGTRVFSVEGLSPRLTERIGPGVSHYHARPGNRLRDVPMSTQRNRQGAQARPYTQTWMAKASHS